MACPARALFIEDVGDGGEAQEAVKADQLVDGGGAGLGPDDGQDEEDEEEDDGTAEEPGPGSPWEEGGGGKPSPCRGSGERERNF